MRGSPTARATWGDVCSLARRISWSDEIEGLYETCVVFIVWGRLVPRVPFSSDKQGMPREIMGVYIFYALSAQYMILHKAQKQDLESFSFEKLA
ncbi:hypothetical protein PM02_01880 [Sulfitobacter mediterraneus]|uniref:Uncharacterized protein n=1 Tax=Sulfitobacter mediterraneus TaxID=83219 RepID=A0A061SVG5_9RHOB|nr:hypothetical protein PM02_01880 [Sulfitobacter mediterraneus]